MANVTMLIENMSVQELKTRLAEYMTADKRYAPSPISVEVRKRERQTRSGRYDIILIMDDGSESVVKFKDNPSRLIYIYTLLHPQGYQHYKLERDNFLELKRLYSKVFFKEADHLIKAINNDFNHFFYQAVAQSRKAIRLASVNSEKFEIAPPKDYNGMSIIPYLSHGEHIVIDSSLR